MSLKGTWDKNHMDGPYDTAANHKRAHQSWVNAQLESAQAQRDRDHKARTRAFYANKRKAAKARRQ